jgi:hypothetical protein
VDAMAKSASKDFKACEPFSTDKEFCGAHRVYGHSKYVLSDCGISSFIIFIYQMPLAWMRILTELKCDFT